MFAHIGFPHGSYQAAVVAALLFMASTAQALTATEIFASAAQSTVFVRNIDANGNQQSIGSGVVLPQGDIATNCHVIKDAAELTVRVGANQRPATLSHADLKRDLCVLHSPELNVPAVKVGSSKYLKVGAKVYAIGAPSGLELTMSDGIVSNLRELGGGRHIQITAAISRGSSGGGLFDEDGALVGLTSFYLAEGQNLNFAIPIDWVNDLLGHKITNEQEDKDKEQVLSATSTASIVKETPLEPDTREDWLKLLQLTQPLLKTQTD